MSQQKTPTIQGWKVFETNSLSETVAQLTRTYEKIAPIKGVTILSDVKDIL